MPTKEDMLKVIYKKIGVTQRLFLKIENGEIFSGMFIYVGDILEYVRDGRDKGRLENGLHTHILYEFIDYKKSIDEQEIVISKGF